MIYYDVFTGIHFRGSDDLVTKLFSEFYIDEVKMAKDTWKCELTKTAKVVSIKHYYDWLLNNTYDNQGFREAIDRVVNLYSDRKICLDMTTELFEHEIIVVLYFRFMM